MALSGIVGTVDATASGLPDALTGIAQGGPDAFQRQRVAEPFTQAAVVAIPLWLTSRSGCRPVAARPDRREAALAAAIRVAYQPGFRVAHDQRLEQGRAAAAGACCGRSATAQPTRGQGNDHRQPASSAETSEARRLGANGSGLVAVRGSPEPPRLPDTEASLLLQAGRSAAFGRQAVVLARRQVGDGALSARAAPRAAAAFHGPWTMQPDPA